MTSDSILTPRPNPSNITVIIPFYGDPGPTQALIDQIHLGPEQPLEVIVVDDESPILFPPCSGVRVLRRTRNGGFGAAVNSGASAANGEFLLILNSDLDLEPEFLSRMAQHAAPFGRAVTAPRVLDTCGRITYSARRWPTVLHQTVEWLTPLTRWRDTKFLRRLLGHDDTLSATAPLEVDWLVGAALMVPRIDFQAVGGIDERYHMNSEEIDLQLRLAIRGLRRVYLPGVQLIHEGGGSSDPAKRRRWLVTSQLRYADKWGGLRRLRLALTVASAINFAWNCIRALRGVDVKPVAVAKHELSLAWGPT